ncbi:iron-containing redox enzyme family protein [Microbacterium sp. zg.Y625]|uniref:iron-containing redox enzyme family protein n=1 Tax=Microbacterium jiangjiandongii TaxID=3049071 RepID=UPI00214CA7A1|nr:MULTISPECIES: iron-containing redox enzyme family protein [unclassified Microbacterium]MCR2793610.1 iron-containing redox enzyme family protein [Microbacterium sp. zg.Y625]MCR2815787.1 iron-containing redox enzyme family protein [Microbacterium sp. zg.Y843]WIM25959.1 iron-containing redox enzyme family protein [Microbacterium sp. zg-Y625]
MTLPAAAEPRIHPRPAARGPLSAAILELLADPAQDAAGVAARAAAAVDAADDVVRDDDVQLSLFLLYALHYGSLGGLPDAREWDPHLLAARHVLEAAFEARLRAEIDVPEAPDEPGADAVARLLFSLTAPTPGPSLARHVAKKASVEQLREFLMHRSIYTLREADPHSWVIPRLTGRAKAALMEIQFDEYGSGDAGRAHAGIFAQTMRGAGLDDTYGAYVDAVPAVTLASLNMMSMFGLNRRLRGAIVGHLAAFEMTSSIPNKHYADGFRRVGFGADVTWYFDEHVEADAVHEQIAGRDLAGALAEDEPDLLPDILFGAAACLAVDGWAGDHILQAWQEGRSALREGFVASP